MSAVDLGCRWLLVVVLALAALGKARGRGPFADFLQTLGGFGFPRAWVGAPLAVGMRRFASQVSGDRAPCVASRATEDAA